MAISFNKANGEAKKSSAEYYSYKMGGNVVRMFGDILPRYQYWVDNPKGDPKRLPFECLQFDRETETFTSASDPVAEVYPDLQCGWAYLILCIAEGKVKVLSLKKTLYKQIQSAAEDLGDPTDVEVGWDCHFKKEKTGPKSYNIEYQLQPLRCKPRPLTEEERELIAASKTIDEMFPVETYEKQKARLEKLLSIDEEEPTEADEGVTQEDVADID